MLSNKIICKMTLGQLPTSYRESMSYEEQVLWLCNILDKDVIPRLNEVIKTVENIDLNFEEIEHEINNLSNEITLIKENYITLTNQVNTMSEEIQALDSKFTNLIEEVDSTLRAIINNNFNTLKNYIDININRLEEKVDNISTTGIMAYNPTNGLLEPLQKVLNDIAQLTNQDGLTASEFDALDLTATAFDNYEITAYEFDSQGKIILV